MKVILKLAHSLNFWEDLRKVLLASSIAYFTIKLSTDLVALHILGFAISIVIWLIIIRRIDCIQEDKQLQQRRYKSRKRGV